MVSLISSSLKPCYALSNKIHNIKKKTQCKHLLIRRTGRLSSHKTKVLKENLEASQQIIEFTQNNSDKIDDLINYSIFQLSSWVLPMTIAGRILNMNYKDIANGLVIIALVKSVLSFYGIIHY